MNMKTITLVAATCAALCANAGVTNVWRVNDGGTNDVFRVAVTDDLLGENIFAWMPWEGRDIASRGNTYDVGVKYFAEESRSIFIRSGKFPSGTMLDWVYVAKVGGVWSWRKYDSDSWKSVENVGEGGVARSVRNGETAVELTVEVFVGSGAWRVETSDDLVTWTTCDGYTFNGRGRRFFRVVKAESEVAK